jgi:hypothetical protein
MKGSKRATTKAKRGHDSFLPEVESKEKRKRNENALIIFLNKTRCLFVDLVIDTKIQRTKVH